MLWPTALFGTAVALGLLFLCAVTPASLVGIGQEAILPFRAIFRVVTGSFDMVALLTAALRVWVFIYVIDGVWTLWKVAIDPRAGARKP